ncbi:uncharacterized protein LOC134242659 [Saccostrea cucullata]|uniref:uncharacterized protein LOC134242659 n=1 Tax=Saccostrea cuccullata TaxID=36930 RepID=UPI002ED0C1E6
MDRLPEFAAFDYADKADAGPKWEKWTRRLELLFTGMNIDDKGGKRALLLHYAGERVFDIYEAEKGDTAPNYAATKQIIQNCRSNRLRRRALREPYMNLKTLLDLGRALEVAETQALTMEAQNERNSVNAMQKSSDKHRSRNPRSKEQVTIKVLKRVCRAKKRASGQHRNYKHVREVDFRHEAESSEEEYMYSINGKKGPQKTLKVNDQTTHVKIGSPKLEKESNPALAPYGGGKELTVFGSCQLTVEWRGVVQPHKFYAVKGNYGALLGYQTCLSFGLVQVDHQLSPIADRYPDLFVGIGKLKDRTVRIHVDESVKPVAQRSRRTPFHLRPKVEAELQKLLVDDIIERVKDEPTLWISPIVCGPKKNPEEIRVCVDMREANNP